MKWRISNETTRLLQEGICSYYLSLAVIYIAHDSTDGQADAMARWDSHSSEGWNRRCCSWRKRAAHGERWMGLVVGWGDEQEIFKRLNLTVSKKGSPAGCAGCGTCWDLHGGRACPNRTKREGTEMLVLHLQENCPSAVLLETELIPEISGKMRIGRSEEAITADLIRGI